MKKKAGNAAFMKHSNRQLILNIIRKGPVSRAEIARRTGLTRAAVTVIISDLIKDGIVIERGTGEAEYGRKPVLLDVNPDYGYVLGLNISRAGCSAGFVNMKGEPVLKREIDISAASNAENAVEVIADNIGIMAADLKIKPGQILGMGVNTPGPVDVYSGIIINPPNFRLWHGFNIVEELKKYFSMKIFLDNNSTALALAEKNLGNGLEYGSFMLMVVDTGIGAGIVINDKLYRGTGGFGSEVGHTTININGKDCSCGNKGCVEVYASIPSILSEEGLREKGIASWECVVDRAEKGDIQCKNIIEKEASYLSACIVNVINILELEAVILTGIVNYKPGMLLDMIRKAVNAVSITRDIHNIKIESSSIMENADIISAAAVVIDKFYND